jgi:hypothetical protein
MSSLRGRIEDFPLIDLFKILESGKKTGELGINLDTESRWMLVYFENGNPVYAYTTLGRERLGEILLEMGKIGQEQLDEALEELETRREQPGVRLGTILVEKGYVTSEILADVVRLQLEESIYALLLEAEGSYQFMVRPSIPLTEDITLQKTTEELLIEGMKRYDDWSQIQAALPPKNFRLRIIEFPSRAMEAIEMTRDEWRVLYHLHRYDTTDSLFYYVPMDRVRLGRALLSLMERKLVVAQKSVFRPSPNFEVWWRTPLEKKSSK